MRDKTRYNERMRVYMLARYHERRAEAVAYLGGKCVECDETEGLELDHVDPSLKTMSVSKLWSVTYPRYRAEIELCQLLCGPHHRAKTAAEQSVEHGGGVSGKKNCPCGLCKAKRAEYMKKYNRKPS